MWPWRHPDPGVDRLQQDVMRIVGSGSRRSRTDVFAQIAALSGSTRGLALSAAPGLAPGLARGLTPPYMTEAWYCCAEPGPEQVDTV
jgi:hypothetical protein